MYLKENESEARIQVWHMRTLWITLLTRV